jgi:adenosine deaminase
MDSQPLPKVELHCHLDGILSREMLNAIIIDDPSFPVNPQVLNQYYPVNDIESFFKWWKAIEPIEGDLMRFVPVLTQHIDNLKSQNVVYSEIMVAAGEIPEDISEALEKMRVLREVTNSLEQGQIQIEFLIAFGRNKSLERVNIIADRIIALYGAGLIVGVALAGPERGFPVKPFASIFARFKEAGLGIEIHAGEWCGAESVQDAINFGYVDRIGHGVGAFQNLPLLEYLANNNIHIEMCPTSNLKTGSIAFMQNHPIQLAKQLGLNYSINTDDPGPFECNMESEFQLVKDMFEFDAEEFRRVFQNSLGARFQSRLRIEVETQLNG